MNPLLPFEWILASRFMREGLMQTLLIISGVALGVSVIVFISALIGGLQKDLFRRTLDYQAQIVIRPPKEVARRLFEVDTSIIPTTLLQPRAQRLRSVDQWQTVRTALLKIPEVEVVAPVVAGAGFVLRGNANKAVSITGMEPESYLRLIALDKQMKLGTANVGTNDILIGKELGLDLGVGLGDKLILQGQSKASVTLTVVGIFDFGNKDFNERQTYIALRTAQSLLNLPGGATSVELNISKPFDAEAIASSVRTQTGLDVESWIKLNSQFFTALQGQSMSNNIIRFFVGLTAALGIASVLVVSVVQKSKEIGILRATGTTRAQILRVFLLQGAVMGLLGSVVGSVAGWALLGAWRKVAVNEDGTPFFTIEFDPWLFLWAAIGATMVGTIAAVFPARTAARMDPAIAIRG
jgi:lipoprotein-releasing system permease protein